MKELVDTLIKKIHKASDSEIVNNYLIELALLNPNEFCQFANAEPATMAFFSGFETIAAQSSDTLYQIFLGLRDYPYFSKGLFLSLVNLNKSEWVFQAIKDGDDKKMPMWLSGLEIVDFVSLYESAAHIFDAIIKKYPDVIVMMLKSKVLAKENAIVYLSILQKHIMIFSSEIYVNNLPTLWNILSSLLNDFDKKNSVFDEVWCNILLFPYFLQCIKLNIEIFYDKHKSVFIKLLDQSEFLNIINQSIAGYTLTTQKQSEKLREWLQSLFQINFNLTSKLYDRNFPNEIKIIYSNCWLTMLAKLALNDDFLSGLNNVAEILNANVVYRFLEKNPEYRSFVLKKLHSQELQDYPTLVTVMQAENKPSWVYAELYEVGEEIIQFVVNAENAARDKSQRILHVDQTTENEQAVTIQTEVPESNIEILHGEQKSTLFADPVKKQIQSLNNPLVETPASIFSTVSSWMGWK